MNLILLLSLLWISGLASAESIQTGQQEKNTGKHFGVTGRGYPTSYSFQVFADNKLLWKDTLNSVDEGVSLALTGDLPQPGCGNDKSCIDKQFGKPYLVFGRGRSSLMPNCTGDLVFGEKRLLTIHTAIDKESGSTLSTPEMTLKAYCFSLNGADKQTFEVGSLEGAILTSRYRLVVSRLNDPVLGRKE